MESVLIGSIVKATLLLLAAFGLTALMRGTSAAARHAIWSAALVGVIVVPLVSIALPWRMGVLPSGWGDSVGSLFARAEGPALEDLSRTPTPTPMSITEDASPVSADHATDVASTTPSIESSGEPALGPTAALARDPWRLVVVAWLGIAAVILARILFGMAWMWRLARRAQPLSGPTWLLPLGRVTERLDLRTAVRVVKSDAAAMPVTCGVLRPAIVLPEESEAWTEERREAVLLHELAHVRRGDLATHLIAWVACSLYWFHPLVWIAARRLRHESERACDDLVLGAGTRASEYAGHLLDIVRTAGRGRAPAAAVPMAQKSSFEGRLLAILEPSVDRNALSPRMKVAVAAALALVVLPLAAMAPAPPGLAGVEGSRVLNGDFDDPVDTAGIPLKEKGWKSSTGTSISSSSSTSTSVSEGEAFGLVEALDGLGPIRFEGETKTENGKTHVAQTQVAQGTIDALETALGDADADVRRTAAEALGSLEDPRAVEALLEALRSDSDETVRKMAAWALGEIESPQAVAGLSQAVRSDGSIEVRAMAAWALGEIESPEGVDALGAALRDSSVEVRRMAVWGLGEIESAEAVEWLTPALRDEDVEIRRKAAWALGEIESAAAVPALGVAMGDSDAEVRSMAAWALGEIESPAAIDALRAGVRDSNVEVRRHTVWALGEIQDARGVAPLSQALADEDREVRKTAVWALGEIEDPSAIPALRPLLQDSDAEIRKTAIWALVEMDDPAVYDILVELLKDEDPEVRKQAAHALGDM